MASIDIGTLLILALPLMFLAYIVLMQRRRGREIAAVQQGVAVGTQIRTTSGLYGTVTALTDADMSLQIAPGVVVRFDRRAVDVTLTADDGGPQAGSATPTDSE
jgi:preprotein translocase subunit YajC